MHKDQPERDPSGTPAERTSRRVLEPIDRVLEVLFGLIMVLTFTGSLSAAESGRAEVRAMLVGALGCNLAWGLIDGLMYLMTCLIERAQSLRTVLAVRGARRAPALRLSAVRRTRFRAPDRRASAPSLRARRAGDGRRRARIRAGA